MMAMEEVWNKTLSEIELTISRASFVTWFKDTYIADQQDGTITVSVPNNFSKEWLENKYHKFILKSVRSMVPSVRSVNYVISQSAAQTPKKPKKEIVLAPDEQLEFKEFYIDPKTNLNPKYTLDSFVVGSFNELAHAAALAVIKNPGRVYNPLFIYGGAGLGKTHLLQGIGNALCRANPQSKIQYITSERFGNELVSSIQNNFVHNFKDKYRDCDLLVVDDVQFFSGKQKTQEEFFHAFNTLYDAGKQVVFSSDKSPKLIPDIGERLLSRMEAGVIVDISEPEYESRLAILKTKAAEKNISLQEKTIELIASTVQKNIRELEGALNTVWIKSRHQNRELALDEVKNILNKNLKPRQGLTFGHIVKAVAEYYDIQEKSIYEHTRKTEIVKPRQIAMYLVREDLQGSYPFIGARFGGMDHTTAIHAYEKISKEIKKNSKLEDELRAVREKYQNYK